MAVRGLFEAGSMRKGKRGSGAEEREMAGKEKTKVEKKAPEIE